MSGSVEQTITLVTKVGARDVERAQELADMVYALLASHLEAEEIMEELNFDEDASLVIELEDIDEATS